MPEDAVGLPTAAPARPRPQGPSTADRPAALATPPTAGPPVTTALAATAPAASNPAASNPATTLEPCPPEAPAAAPGADQHQTEPIPLPAALLGAGLLGAGVVALLGRYRRAQQRHRRRGRRIPLPSGDLAQAEAALRAGMDPEGARFLDLAMRAMAAGLGRDRTGPPDVTAVLLGPERLEVLLGAPAAAPPPFAAGPGGRRWRLDRGGEAELAGLAAEVGAPLPGLVTLGHAGRDRLLVNLESPGSIALTGPAADARPLLDAMAVELATSLLAGHLELVLVGFDLPALERLERVRMVDDLTGLLPGLEHQAQEVTELLGELGCGSVLGGRVADGGGDNWTPTVVLCAQPPARKRPGAWPGWPPIRPGRPWPWWWPATSPPPAGAWR
jgi:hypothetical protein